MGPRGPPTRDRARAAGRCPARRDAGGERRLRRGTRHSRRRETRHAHPPRVRRARAGVPSREDQSDAGMGRGGGQRGARRHGCRRAPAHRRREWRLRVARPREEFARPRRRRPPVHRAAPRPGRARRLRGAESHAAHAGLPRRDPYERHDRTAGDGAGRAPRLEHQGASGGRPRGGVPDLPACGPIRRRPVGRDDARIGYRLPGGARGGRLAAVRLPV